jgi:hypothetical protein
MSYETTSPLLSEMFRKKVVDINLNRHFICICFGEIFFFYFWRLETRIVKLRLTAMKIASFFLEETKSLFLIVLKESSLTGFLIRNASLLSILKNQGLGAITT